MPGECVNRPSLRRFSSKPNSGFGALELIILVVIIGLLVALILPNVRSARPAARRVQCKNNLKQIALALINYAEVYHALPPAYTVDARGNRLHSWRTLILPYLEQEALYKKIDLSKAWDDPANADAVATSISTYTCPDAHCPTNYTTYLAVVAPNSCLLPTKPRPLSEITRQASTLMVIEVDSDRAAHWMAPVDADEALVLALNPSDALPHSAGMNAAFVDGSVQYLSAETSSAIRRALISIAPDDKRVLESNESESGPGVNR